MKTITISESKNDNPQDVTERIKTFEDALKELGGDHSFVKEYQRLTINGAPSADVEAYLKLRIICAALNEGWKPQFTEDERRWFPWLLLYTQIDIDKMNEQEKTHRHIIPTSDDQTEYAGLAYSSSGLAAGGSFASIGFRLCLKTEELAEYCGKQFIHLWADFYIIRK